MKSTDFLSPGQQTRLVNAIKQAELDTSGEIRIHIDDKCKCDPREQAARVFGYLGMDRTELHNGVLIYLACQSKVFAIVGDKGINDVVPEHFWEDVVAVMSSSFREGDFAGGLEKAVLMTGTKLKEFFPYHSDDINEQPDDISFGTSRDDAAGRK